MASGESDRVRLRPQSCTKTYQVSDFVVVYVAAAASRPFCALLLSLSTLPLSPSPSVHTPFIVKVIE